MSTLCRYSFIPESFYFKRTTKTTIDIRTSCLSLIGVDLPEAVLRRARLDHTKWNGADGFAQCSPGPCPGGILIWITSLLKLDPP